MRIRGIVERGYGVASGASNDPRFPEGTLALQMPRFRALGLELGDCYPGTINVNIAPLEFAVRRFDYCFEHVAWCPAVPAETFSFCRGVLHHAGTDYRAWIYYPHPETKPEHFQTASTLEILAPQVPGLRYGDAVLLRVADGKLVVRKGAGTPDP